MNKITIRYQLSPPSQWPLKTIEVTEDEFKSGKWMRKIIYPEYLVSYEKI